MDIKDIILLTLVIIIIYLIYRKKTCEKFDINNDIITAVNNQYKIDMDAMRNLASFTNTLHINNDTYTFPSTTTKAIDLIVEGDLEVNGNIKFINKNSNILEIFPRFMIMAWNNNNIPNGWAECNGLTYMLKLDGNAIVVNDTNPEGIKTPDLRSRFIIGAGDNTIDGPPLGEGLTVRSLGSFGGNESHTLTENEMPPHSHEYTLGVSTIKNFLAGTFSSLYDGDDIPWMYAGKDDGNVYKKQIQTSLGGSGEAFNLMPPFYSLYYIMKL
jgi:microcystin-dependent protein